MLRALDAWPRLLLIATFSVVPIAGLVKHTGESQMAAIADETAIRNIVHDEIAAWNRGDASAYSSHFAADGTCTNIRGQFFTGHAAFLKQHDVIFQGLYKNTTLNQEIVSLKFLGPDVAVVETVNAVSGMAERAQGMGVDMKGRLRTRLLQVVAKQGGEWKIVAYHNVDVKPGVPVADPT